MCEVCVYLRLQVHYRFKSVISISSGCDYYINAGRMRDNGVNGRSLAAEGCDWVVRLGGGASVELNALFAELTECRAIGESEL